MGAFRNRCLVQASTVRLPSLRAFLLQSSLGINSPETGSRATGVNQIWVGDITYLSVAGQWRYLAVVMDQYSRRILAWGLGATRDTCLTRAVFDAAIRRRRTLPGLIFHSVRGSEYASAAFRDRPRCLGCSSEHDPWRRSRGQRSHGIVLSFSQSRSRAWYPLPDRGWTPLRTPTLSLVLQPSTPALGLGLPIAR